MWLYDEENTPTRAEDTEFEMKSMSIEKASGMMKESPMQNHYISSSYQRPS